jgi:hypothetical protein
MSCAKDKDGTIPIALTAAAGVLKSSRRVTVEAANIALDFVMGASLEYGRDCDIAYVSENDLTAHHTESARDWTNQQSS